MLQEVGKEEILSVLLEDLKMFLFSLYTYIYESSQLPEDQSLDWPFHQYKWMQVLGAKKGVIYLIIYFTLDHDLCPSLE